MTTMTLAHARVCAMLPASMPAVQAAAPGDAVRVEEAARVFELKECQ
jgi:hypothetical protein